MPPAAARTLRPSSRAALIALAVALLLKAAVPWLAAVAAAGRQQAVAEVCTVYGVATVAAHGDAAPVSPDGGGTDARLDHATGDGCALGALTLLAGTGTPAGGGFAGPFDGARAPVAPDAPPPADAAARWAARLTHAPPFLA